MSHPRRLSLFVSALLAVCPAPLFAAGVDSPEYQQKLEEAKKVVADWNSLPPDQIHADPSAADWPGAVPADAVRLKQQRFDLNTDFPRWRGKTDRVTTGFYAPAGEVVTVEIPESFAKLGVQVRIGCHSDNANKKSVAKRFPFSISKAWPLNAAGTKVASPFGGTVYLEVPKEVTGKIIPVRFSGVVQQPWFVLGKTSPTEWRDKIRNHPGPFAEMSCGPLTLSVPSADVRKLEDPTALMSFYKKGMACVQELSGPPVPVVERIVYDVSISAGSMHSGYPIMAGSKRKEATDLAALENGLWGFFHEMGHNQQWGGWSPPGQGETTCNLFPLYVMSQVQGKKPRHPWKFDRSVLAKPLERGAIGSNLNGNHALSIAFWIQLINGIGWEPVKKTINEYHAKDAPEAPKGAEPIWDRLMLALSKNSRKDLTPFFKAWGAEFSPAGEEAVKKLRLPSYLPDDAPGQPRATQDTGSI
ncbi:M60 family metallopeptidase [Luteolibacter ambystomatis]|uniref:M60 family metallopeptidase n=1 Tax=Luteolibacter ambystomatis TaxID=2824561 RepID=A0A975IYM9_9BACT|nr:M60 family metallopeptidase [Luteolibacter ambystomatis]QUE50309.1 M60 family metallopeptidase [Luteolibacter ambystomatis]